MGYAFLVAGYLVIVAFFVIQRFLRVTPDAKSFSRGRFDRGSSFLIWVSVGAGLSLPLLLDYLGFAVFRVDVLEGAIALAVMLFAVGLRVWAAVTLGKFYSTTLLVAEDHHVVSTGPYARIRHPGYLSEILMWEGLAVLCSNLLLVIIFPIMTLLVYLYRISVEERMLNEKLGDEYIEYRRKTRRLIPFVY